MGEVLDGVPEGFGHISFGLVQGHEVASDALELWLFGEAGVDLGEENFEVEDMVVFMSGGVANGADESFVLAVLVDADEVEHLAFMQVAFGAF